MVYVTHDRYDRCTGRKVIIFFKFLLLFHFELLLHIDKLHFVTEFISNKFDYLGVETLVDGYHQAKAHTFTNYFCIAHIHQVCQFAHTDKFSELKLVILHIVSAGLFGHLIPLGTAVFRLQTLPSTARTGQLCLRFTYFILDFLLINFFCFA